MSDADETGVVTVLLRNGSDVLLLRRSDAVGSYGGQWGTVAGHAEGDPERLALEESSEGTGFDPDDLSFVRRGASFPVADPDHGTCRVNRAMHGAADAEASDEGTGAAAAVRRSAESLLADLDDACIDTPDALRGATVATLSRSGTVRDLLARCAPAEVVVTESRPGGEGRAVACDADAVLVGADTVPADGSVLNKVGTRTLASAAAAQDVPVYVAAHTDKMAPPGHEADLEPRDAGELLGSHSLATLRVEHPTFDVTPPGLVDRYLTDRGPLTTDEVGTLAERADWPRP